MFCLKYLEKVLLKKGQMIKTLKTRHKLLGTVSDKYKWVILKIYVQDCEKNRQQTTDLEAHLPDEDQKSKNIWTLTNQVLQLYSCADPEGVQTSSPPPPPTRKITVAIDFLRNTGTDPHREAIGPKGVQLLIGVGPYGLCEIC